MEVVQTEYKINHLQKNKIQADSLKEFIKNNPLILKTHNVFTEEINKIALSQNDDKRIQSIDSVEIYTYGMNKDFVCKKEEISCNNIIKQYKNV